jgi:hypothetical protein
VVNVLCKGSRIEDQIILLRLLLYPDDLGSIVFLNSGNHIYGIILQNIISVTFTA